MMKTFKEQTGKALHRVISLAVIVAMLMALTACSEKGSKNKEEESGRGGVCTICNDLGHGAHEHPSCTVCGSKTCSADKHCPVCGSLNHTKHPSCAVCGSTKHTKHPTCPECGSTSHTTHPEPQPEPEPQPASVCPVCGCTDHGQQDHAPTCPICGSSGHTREFCPNSED